MTESGDSEKAPDQIDGPNHPRFKKMVDFVLGYEGGGPNRTMDEKNESEVVACSDCFQNEGLRLDAYLGGEQDESACKRCRSQTGRKLTRAHLEILAGRFFVRGTFERTEYGGAPIIQFNGRRKTDIQTPNWLESDISLFEDLLGIGFFYYGPRLWMIGEVYPLQHLQEATTRGAVIQRILREYPVKSIGAEQKFYRLRMTPGDATNAMEFDSPPEQFLGRGRFDRKHLPIMYASPDLEVCIHECRVSAEDELAFATLSPTRDLRFLDLTALLPYEHETEFESLDMALHMLFLAGSHSYEIARDIASAAHQGGFDGILYPSYFSLLRTGGMPFETVFGISHRKIDRFADREREKTIPNMAVFGRPISGGLVQIKCINRLRLERVAYRYHFGPVGYQPAPLGPSSDVQAKQRPERLPMIKDRFYEPTDGELIYHYCRPEAFLEIVKHRAMWFSAYWVMNDALEREWGYTRFYQVMDALRSELNEQFVEQVMTAIRVGTFTNIAMISCYSLDADVLSQWRAYADDGRGFAIGFDPKLMQMPAKKLRVLYDEATQASELAGNLRHVFNYEQSIGFKYDEQFRSHWVTFGMDLIAYKHQGFREEKEIRLVHASGLVPENETFKIVALGARDKDGKQLIGPQEIRFRVSNGIVIPYVALDYSDNGKQSPIKEVILGPRNDSAETNIQIFLNTIGVQGVRVRRSTVPYR
jgi:RES domain/Protein of unknown function (DUF2971)